MDQRRTEDIFLPTGWGGEDFYIGIKPTNVFMNWKVKKDLQIGKALAAQAIANGQCEWPEEGSGIVPLSSIFFMDP